MIRRHVGLAAELAGVGRGRPPLRAGRAPCPQPGVLRHAAGDDATDALIDAANATGRALFTRTVLDGRFALRVCIGGRATQRRHVEAAWELLQSLAS